MPGLRRLVQGVGQTKDGSGIAIVGLGLLVILWSQLAWVRLSNFGGYDEWLLLSLTSRGVIDSPYSNRPFNFLWTLPGTWLTPHDFTGFYLLHVMYMWLWGVCIFWICRRLLPGESLLAFLAGVFSVVWMPLDLLRLSAVQGTFYSGFTLSMLLATLLYAESWLRRSHVLLIAASATAYLTVRGYEAAAPFLLFVPALVLWRRTGPPTRRWPWLALWTGLLSLALALALRPMLFPTGEPTYQNSVWGGPNMDPGAVLSRVARQYLLHLIPLIRWKWAEVAVPAAPISVLVFAATFLLAAPRFSDGMPAPRRRLFLLGIMGIGLAFAGLGYSALVVGGADGSATRMQFYSTPGIALFLAGAVGLAASAAPERWRRTAMVALAASIVAIGSGRTIAMQQGWANFDHEPRQRLMLRQLVALAPDLQPGTLVVLIDEARAWPATFGFRHAVEYLYPDRATGYAWNAYDLLYPTTFDEDGVKTVPWASIQKSWAVRPTLHRYDQISVFRFDASLKLARLDAWPAELPPLPGNAVYVPAARLAALTHPQPERGVLK